MTLCGKLENTAAIVAMSVSSISPRIVPKDTSMTLSSPDPLTKFSRSPKSGLAGVDRRGPTNLVSEGHKSG